MQSRRLARKPRMRDEGGNARHARCARGALLVLALAACNNSPYPDGAGGDQHARSSSFDERSPRYLDPTASYANPESAYTYQIYEPLYGYHYLKRPYELVPKAAAQVAKPHYLDKDGQAPARRRRGRADRRERLRRSRSSAASCTRRTRRSPRTRKGEYLYHAPDAGPSSATSARRWDFEQQGTRELVADDFVYAIKRHATPRIEAPIYGIFSEYVLGLKDYGKLIKAEDKKLLRRADPRDACDKPFLDFRKWPLEGATRPTRTRCASASRASTRSGSTGWRCPSWRRCPGRPTSSMRSRA